MGAVDVTPTAATRLDDLRPFSADIVGAALADVRHVVRWPFRVEVRVLGEA